MPERPWQTGGKEPHGGLETDTPFRQHSAHMKGFFIGREGERGVSVALWEEREIPRCRKTKRQKDRHREREAERQREWGPELGRRKEREEEEEEEETESRRVLSFKGTGTTHALRDHTAGQALPVYWACMQE